MADQHAVHREPLVRSGARLHTRSAVTAPWLSQAIGPAARAARAQGVPVRLRRGWRFGTHVDLVAATPAGRVPDWPAVAGLLDAGPEPAVPALDEHRYLAQARELGRLEDVPPPYLPMKAHGTVELLADADVVRSPLDDVRDPVAAALCPVVLDTLDDIAAEPRNGPARIAEAFVALADTHVLGLAYGVFSLRSHAEAFLAWAGAEHDLRAAFTARRATEGAVLRTAVEQRLSGLAGRRAGEWRTALAYGAGVLDTAVAAGALSSSVLDARTAGLDPARMGPPGRPGAAPRDGRPDTDFHRAVAESGVTDGAADWFVAYRTLINFFYEQLPLLTITPMQRYYLCSAIADTVDEVLGQSWQERLDQGRQRLADGLAVAP